MSAFAAFNSSLPLTNNALSHATRRLDAKAFVATLGAKIPQKQGPVGQAFGNAFRV
jgi:hypothetical protein